MSDNNDIYNKIIEKLTQKIHARYTCPICKSTSAYMNISEGLTYNFLQSFNFKDGKLNLAGKQVPSCLLICSNCGFMSQHAVIALFDGEEAYLDAVKEK